MDIISIITSILALLFVAALIGMVSFLLRKYGTERIAGSKNSDKKRLSVNEVKVLDPKHKMMLVGCDGKEHLLVIGINGVSVVDSDVKSPKKEAKSAKNGKK